MITGPYDPFTGQPLPGIDQQLFIGEAPQHWVVAAAGGAVTGLKFGALVIANSIPLVNLDEAQAAAARETGLDPTTLRVAELAGAGGVSLLLAVGPGNTLSVVGKILPGGVVQKLSGAAASRLAQDLDLGLNAAETADSARALGQSLADPNATGLEIGFHALGTLLSAAGTARSLGDVTASTRVLQPRGGICFLAGTPVLQHASDTLAIDTAFAAIDDDAGGESNWYHTLGATTIALVGWGIGNMPAQNNKRRRKKRKAMLESHKERSADARFEEEVWGEFDGTIDEREARDCSVAQAIACSRATKECNAQQGEPQAVVASSQAKTSQCEAANSPARCRSTWSRRKKIGAAWLACWIAVACALFGFGWNGSDNAPVAPATQVSYSQSPASATIELLEPGRKVMGDRSAGEMAGGTQVDPKTWRLLSLRTETVWADGTLDVIEVKTLQPPEWIAQHKAQVGATVPLPLELLEMGLPEDLSAVVVANEPCPEIEDGPGRVVLTTVNHLNNDVWELTVVSPNGQTETVRPTGLHKFFRPIDDAWVSTKDLKLGDELQGVDGPIVVQRLEKIPGVHRVYNMTVEGEHVYRVSLLGALVHNNGCAQPTGGRLGNSPTRKQIADIQDELRGRGWDVTKGGRLGEEYIPGPGNARAGSAYSDITAFKNGRPLRINTIDTLIDGLTPTAREARNAAKIRQLIGDDHLLLIPKP